MADRCGNGLSRPLRVQPEQSFHPSPPLSALTIEHEVTLSGLISDTRYYYAVGSSSGMLAGDDSYSFVTAPDSGVVAPTRIWVIGDSGTANDNARAVRDSYKTFTGTRGTDIWLMLGDNAYPDGTDEQFQAAVFDMYPKRLRQVPLWLTLGNHDGHTADSATQTGPYYDIFTLPTEAEAGGLASGTEAYYSFDYANIHFISLESYETDRLSDGAMMTWLQNDLALTTKDWIIAFWHHPPYSKGSHDSDTESSLIEMRENALPILEFHGVDIVLSGHSHGYERSFLLDGHYDTSGTLDPPTMILDGGDGREDGDGAYAKSASVGIPHEGAVYAVAGSSGSVGSSGTLDHPAMFISLRSLGSMVLDIYGNRLHAVFLDNGLVVRDHFSIIKEPDAVPPAIVLAEATEPNTVTVLYAEPVDVLSAETSENYAICWPTGTACDNGISITARLAADARTVLLTTDEPLSEGTPYTLIVNDVEDVAQTPNVIAPDSKATFTYVIPPEPATHVENIDMSRKAGGKKWQTATAEITIASETGQLVSEATVFGDWSGLFDQSVSGLTGLDGAVSFDSPHIAKSEKGQFVFSVNGVSADGRIYDTAANVETSDCIDTDSFPCGSDPGGDLFNMRVSSPPDVSVAADRKHYRGTAEVTVALVGNDEAVISGATVTGDWEFQTEVGQPTLLGSASETTDTMGVATLRSPKKRANAGDEFRFTVTGVRHPGGTYLEPSSDPSGSAQVP